LLVIPVFGTFRLYSAHQLAPAEEFRRLILAVTVTVMSLFTISFWSSLSLSRLWLGLGWILSIVLALATRRIWHYYVWRVRGRGKLTFRTLIVGANEEGRRLSEVMQSDRLGFEPIGFVTVRPSALGTPGSGGFGRDLPVLGPWRNVAQIAEETGAECLFVASSAVGIEEMSEISKTARLAGIEVRLTSALPEVLSTRLAVQPLGGIMALSLKPATLTSTQAMAKRGFDITVSVTAALLTLPLWVLIALAIKVTSPGPILYRQTRIGERGRPFTLQKFRTMVSGAESMVDHLQSHNEADGPLFKMRDDPRVTAVGRWLRRWSLDELPQLLNVLRGEMSLVGPRPPLPEEVAQYEEWHFERLEVLPGITGLWQVKGRSDVSFNEYVRLDLFYIENWSLAYDLYIIFRTGKAVFSRKGAY
jgi:exopolysaccharide biosynthesis polyprenyl glycosylphosphotransferase